jgi:hypothetical protein
MLNVRYARTFVRLLYNSQVTNLLKILYYMYTVVYI